MYRVKAGVLKVAVAICGFLRKVVNILICAI